MDAIYPLPENRSANPKLLRDLGGAAKAQAQISVYVECDLRFVGIDCQSRLIPNFFSDYPSLIRSESFDEASIRIKISDEPLSPGTLIHLKTSADPTIGTTPITLDLRYINEDLTLINQQLIQVMMAGIAGHLKVLSVTDDTQAITIRYLPRLKDETQQTETPKDYYFEINANGSISGSGIGAVNADGSKPGSNSFLSGSLSSVANVSKDRYRLYGAFEESGSKSAVADGKGGQIVGKNSFRYAIVSTVVSLGNVQDDIPNRWNLVWIATYFRSRNMNIENNPNTSIGIEYTLVPFRTDEDHEVRIQMGLTREALDLIAPNILGNQSEVFTLATANLFTFWLFNEGKGSLSIQGSARKNLNYSGFYDLSASTSFRYQINKNIGVSFSSNWAYRPRSISIEGLPDYSNQLQTQFQGAVSGHRFGVQAGVIVRIGDGLGRNRDRRGGY